MTTDTDRIEELAQWLRERSRAFNLAYIKNDLLACADRIEHLQAELPLKDAALLLERDRAEKAEATANLLRDELMNTPPDIQERVLKLLGIWPLHDYEAAIERTGRLKAQVKMLVETLQKMAEVKDCGCGVPCDCCSWTSFVRQAREALAKIKE